MKQDRAFSWWTERFLAALAGGGGGPAELRTKRSILRRHLVPAFAELELQDLNQEVVERYKQSALARGLSAKTVNNHLAVLRASLRFAVRAGALAELPPIENLTLDSAPPPTLNREQVERLLRASDPEHAAMILVAVRAGLRLGELRSLRWQDVDLVQRVLQVRPRDGSAPPRRVLPLNATVVAALRKLPRRGPWVFSNPRGEKLSHGACKRPLQRAARRAGLPAFGWETLRYTFARELLALNVSIEGVQKLLGCRSSASILRCAPLARDPEQAVLLLGVRDGAGAAWRSWNRGEPSQRRSPSTLLVLVPNDGRNRAELPAPALGVLGVPMVPGVPRLETTN